MAGSGDPRPPERDALVAWIVEAVGGTADRRVGTLRTIRREATARMAPMAPDAVLRVAYRLLEIAPLVPRWLVYELVHHHPFARASLDASTLERLGRGMSSWGEVDPFATYLAGVAWREGSIPDEEVHAWARSSDRWWRRAALVSTVALNNRARGGEGDAARTLAVCRLLEEDRDDMVVKALSWALRALAQREPDAVRSYLEGSGDRLAPRVRREVRNKLETGRKNPPRGEAPGSG